MNETGSGWQTTNLANPIQVTTNTTYIISVNSNTTYGATNQGLATSISNGPLSSVADGNNGVYGTTGIPDQVPPKLELFSRLGFPAVG